MDKEILEFLYSFYKKGDYTSHHSLKDIFDKLKRKKITNWSDQNSIKDVWNSINRLNERNLIHLDHSDFSTWGQLKEGQKEFNYIENQIMAVLTEEGAKRVRQERVDDSVIRTNSLTILNMGLTLTVAIIVTITQCNSNDREIKRDEREILKSKTEDNRQSEQENRVMLLKNTLDSIRQSIDNLKEKKKSPQIRKST